MRKNIDVLIQLEINSAVISKVPKRKCRTIAICQVWPLSSSGDIFLICYRHPIDLVYVYAKNCSVLKVIVIPLITVSLYSTCITVSNS